MIIKFKIDNQTIRATNYNTVVADSVNFVGANFSFDEEWEGYIKTVTFINIKTHVEKSILLSNEQTCTCHIPWEVLQDEGNYGGRLNVYVEGFYNGSVATTATMNKPLFIKDSGRNDCGFPSPTPDIYQQILNRLNWIQSKLLSECDIQLLISERLESYLGNYLSKDNTEEYEPSEDYNPATKKYVDEYIESVKPEIDPDTKHWFIGNTDTEIIAEGQNGEAGFSPAIDVNTNTDEEFTLRITTKTGSIITPNLIGAAGKDGSDGTTPHIGDNGNWYIGDIDTGISAGPVNADN